MKLVADLNQFKPTAGLADVGQLVAVATSRAEKEDAKVVNIRLALGEFQVDRAALASPHSHLRMVEEAIVA